jgi:pantoate--beta-alanine ligase
MTRLIHEISELTREPGVVRAFVPTMGALHQGHLDLVDASRSLVGKDGEVVVSIFVNPTQFGNATEVSKYPRTLESDLARCEASGVDIVFAPSVGEMYPDGTQTSQYVSVQPGPLGSILEGVDRPGHFAGMLTIVAKLLNLVQPNFAAFGEKDYQQLALISHMVQQLNFPVKVVGVQTRREPDGLAMSSRNAFLNPEQRTEAASISRALFAAQAVVGNVDAKLSAARDLLSGQIETSYLVAMTSDLSRKLDGTEIAIEGRILFAGLLGSTRLIDNVPLGGVNPNE